jgi:hypothetical protein
MKIEELEKALEAQEKVLEETKKHLENIKVEIKKLNENSFEPTPKDWRPKHKEKYWIAHYNLKPTIFFNEEEYLNEPIIKYNRTFKAKEECQLYCDIQRAFMDVSREFKSLEDNFFVYYDYTHNKVTCGCDRVIRLPMYYFNSEETVQNLIDKFGEENVKRYYLNVYD